MKASLAIALAGALLIAAPALVFAEDAGAPPQPAQPQASGDDFAAQKNAYLKDMHQDMDDWGRKIDQYAQAAKAGGKQAAGDADKDLQQAWAATKRASRHVAHATKKGWGRAKAAYERASGKLKREWQEHNGQ